jgi:aerobic carbon-monoxide dehydrogenase medium subunit
MIPRFSLTRARQLDEAFAAFAAGDGEATYLAGGTELLQVMKMGLASFSTLIDLKGIAALTGIAVEGGRLRIGAAATHREIEGSAIVAAGIPALTSLARGVANARVRNQGTLGGNLAFAEPHSDPAALLVACGATLELAGPAGVRQRPVDGFVLGPLETDRAPEEVLVAVEIRTRRPGEGIAYQKLKFFERPAVSVAVRLTAAAGRVAEARVAVGSLSDRPLLMPGMAAALEGAGSDDIDAAVRRAHDALSSIDAVADLNGSADYKRHLAGVLLGRAARAALEEATTDA